MGKEKKKKLTPTGMCHLEESTYRLKVVKLLICILTHPRVIYDEVWYNESTLINP